MFCLTWHHLTPEISKVQSCSSVFFLSLFVTQLKGFLAKNCIQAYKLKAGDKLSLKTNKLSIHG